MMTNHGILVRPDGSARRVTLPAGGVGAAASIAAVGRPKLVIAGLGGVSQVRGLVVGPLYVFSVYFPMGRINRVASAIADSFSGLESGPEIFGRAVFCSVGGGLDPSPLSLEMSDRIFKKAMFFGLAFSA